MPTHLLKEDVLEQLGGDEQLFRYNPNTLEAGNTYSVFKALQPFTINTVDVVNNATSGLPNPITLEVYRLDNGTNLSSKVKVHSVTKSDVYNGTNTISLDFHVPNDGKYYAIIDVSANRKTAYSSATPLPQKEGIISSLQSFGDAGTKTTYPILNWNIRLDGSIATQLAQTTNHKKIDLTTLKDKGVDIVDTIHQKLNEGYTWFVLPRFTRFNKTLSIYERAITNNGGIVFEGSGMVENDIELNTGGVGIRVSASNRVVFKNLSLTSINMPTPSTIGILYERTATKDVCQWNNLENVTIKMHHDVTANGGLGTIGLYNDTSELCEYRNLTSWADIPVVISRDDILNLGVQKNSLSMKCVAFTGVTTLIAMKGHALILDGVSDFTFENLYCTKDLYTDYANNTEQYAIQITGTVNSGYENYCVNIVGLDIETFPAAIKIDAKMRFLRVHGNHHNATISNLVKVTGANGQLTSSEIKLSMINKTSEFSKIDLVLFDETCLGADGCTFHLNSTQQITTHKILNGCVIYSANAPTIVKNHSFTQTVLVLSSKGLGVNNNGINWSYNAPTAPGNAGDIMFNQNQGAAQGNPVGWVHNGSAYFAFGQVGYRTTTGSPTLTPKQVGEEVLDTTNKIWYKAVGTTNSDWKQLTV